jgi:hypothetical protein
VRVAAGLRSFMQTFFMFFLRPVARKTKIRIFSNFNFNFSTKTKNKKNLFFLVWLILIIQCARKLESCGGSWVAGYTRYCALCLVVYISLGVLRRYYVVVCSIDNTVS